MALDRVSVLRSDPAWVAERVADPASRAIAVRGDGVVLHDHTLARIPLSADVARQPVLLGLEDGVALFGLDLERAGERGAAPAAAQPAAGAGAQPAAGAAAQPAAGAEVISLRDAATVLPRTEAGLAAYAVALVGWHRRHGHCANCGAPTDVAEGGYARHCDRCGATHFPRTDPVVIVLVEHEGRLLLGRQPRWPGRRYSVLAGFIAPGETAEEAVVREVLEESGIAVHDVRYVASQPWPFPSSLMLGFEARSDGGDPVPRDKELADVRWFDLDEVRAAASWAEEAAASRLQLPPPLSIARFLIDRRLAAD